MIAADLHARIVAAFASERFDEAVALLTQAHRADRADTNALVGLGHALRRLGRLSEAVRALDAGLSIDGRRADLWLERAHTLEAGGSLVAALDSYRRAAELAPALAAAQAGAAGVAVRLGHLDEARTRAQAALQADPLDRSSAIAMAQVELEEGDAQAAAARLEALVAQAALHPQVRARALSLLGQARDKLDQTAAAFDAFARSNALFVQGYNAEPGAHRRFVDAIARDVAQVGAPAWCSPSPGASTAPVVRHVFLLGYPRSGTTLVENVLASAPDVMAVEEWPSLRDADEAFLGVAGGIERLVELTKDGADGYRAAYWRRALGSGAAPATFVDMDPLKSLRLPLIARLFPGARVLLMQRDPRDVVWSCFRTLLAPTQAAFDMSALIGTAQHYDAVMRLVVLCRDSMPIDVHVVRYEALVADFDATTRAMCDFTGIAWSEDLRAFDRTAKLRGVTTASASQVRRGLYDGSGQWRRYADRLAPVLPILASWIERFGYERQ